MSLLPPGSCAEIVTLSRRDLTRMLALVRTLYRLSKHPAYLAYLHNRIPEIAHYNPGHDGVLMGYDFHISPEGPKLIEVNTNAGGLWLACQSAGHGEEAFAPRLAHKLLLMFRREFALWSASTTATLKTVAIVDAQPTQQFLFPEMQAYARLLSSQGIRTFIVDPEELQISQAGVYVQGERVDLLYNRHCDFYLHSEAMTPIRRAWLNHHVCLSPNPHNYAVLADKQRLIDWSTPESLAMLPLTAQQQALLQATVPKTRLLASTNLAALWQQRKNWVFKPDNAFASRGVYLGKKLTLSKFGELQPQSTLMQEFIAPSESVASNGQSYKMDLRLFVYQDQALALGARLYQGQVTNLRTCGGGFATVKIISPE